MRSLLLMSPRACLVALIVVLVSGCGLSQVQKAAHTHPTQPVIPTPTPVPTIALTGGGSVAATIGKDKIPMARFREFLNAESTLAAQVGRTIQPSSLIHQAALQLAQYDVVSVYARAHGIRTTTAQVNSQLNSPVQSSQSGAPSTTFRALLHGLGFSPASVRFIAQNDALEKAVESKIGTPKTSGLIATARHILISPGPTASPCTKKPLTLKQARALAVQLRHEIQTGTKRFSAVAKKCSADTSSAAHGGILQDPSTGGTKLYETGSFVAPFEKAVFQGPLRQLQLIHSQFGYHIVQVLTRKQGKYPASVSLASQSQNFNNWLTKAVKRAGLHVLVKPVH